MAILIVIPSPVVIIQDLVTTTQDQVIIIINRLEAQIIQVLVPQDQVLDIAAHHQVPHFQEEVVVCHRDLAHPEEVNLVDNF